MLFRLAKKLKKKQKIQPLIILTTVQTKLKSIHKIFKILLFISLIFQIMIAFAKSFQY